jgi:hypothetical protein
MFIERRHCLFVDFSKFLVSVVCLLDCIFKIDTVDDKGLHKSRRMQGFPLEVYEPFPLNSVDDIYCEEVDNHSDTGSVATPLLTNPEITLVMVEEGTC